MGKLKPMKKKKADRKASVIPMLLGLAFIIGAVWYGAAHAMELNAWFVEQYQNVTNSK